MANLGTSKKPVIVRVQTEVRAREITQICERYGCKFIIGIEQDKTENISDVLKLLKKRRSMPQSSFTPVYNRNDYCPCGSGQKYKNCCWDKNHQEVVGDD